MLLKNTRHSPSRVAPVYAVLTVEGVRPASSVVVTVSSKFSTLSSDSTDSKIGISSSSTVCSATGTAMMKMISITSMTSTSGVVLMSDIGDSTSPPTEIAIAVVLSQYWPKGRAARMSKPALPVHWRGSGLGGRRLCTRRGRGGLRGLLGRSRGHRGRPYRATRRDVGQKIGREGREKLGNPTVAVLQPVVGEHRRNRDEKAERGHDQRFTHRTGHLVDRRRAGHADVDQRAIDADHGAEQPDERCGRADGCQERQTAGQLRVDRSFRTRERAVQPLVRFERVGHLGVLGFGREAIVDQLAPGAVLFEFRGAFLERVGAPESRPNRPVLTQNAPLLHQFGDENVERAYGHDHENAENGPGDDTALFHRLPEPEAGLGGSVAAGCGQKFNKHAGIPLFGKSENLWLVQIVDDGRRVAARGRVAGVVERG